MIYDYLQHVENDFGILNGHDFNLNVTMYRLLRFFTEQWNALEQ